MKVVKTSLVRGISDRLIRAAYWLENKLLTIDPQSKFIDLAPTDDADKELSLIHI